MREEYKLRMEEQHKQACKIKKQIADYIDSYFAKTFKEILYWDPIEDFVIPMDVKNVKQTLLTPPEDKKHFNVQNYFFNLNHRIYKKIFKMHKPRVFKNEFGEYFINTYTGCLHKERPEKFDKEVIKNAQLFWDHIKNIWASRNEEQFLYLKKWLCCAIAGKKMKSILYGKSGQGTGKSIIVDMIRNHILGNHLIHVTDSHEVVVPNSFESHHLEGKLMLCLEEPTATTNAQWGGLTQNLKQVATHEKISIRHFFHASYLAQNLLSVIVLSNKDSICVDSDDRRFFVMDISNEYKQNKAYFSNLLANMMNDKVGEYLYWTCLDYCESDCADFHEQTDRPSTKSGQELKLRSLHSVFDFIKIKYVLKNKGIEIKYKDFWPLCAHGL